MPWRLRMRRRIVRLVCRNAGHTVSTKTAAGIMPAIFTGPTCGFRRHNSWFDPGFAIGIHRHWRLILRRNVRSWHRSLHIVVGQDATVAPVSIPVSVLMISTSVVAHGAVIAVTIAITKPVAARTRAPCSRPAIVVPIARAIQIAPRPAYNWMTYGRGLGRNRRVESRRRIGPPRTAPPSVPLARRPAPATPAHEHPVAVAIRHPSPWIGRNPRITKARRVSPITVAERVPSQSNTGWLPYFPITGSVKVVAVLVQVTYTILVR